MQNLSFTLRPEFYDKVQERIAGAEQAINAIFNKFTASKGTSFTDQLPSREQVQILIETAFWTSIEREEGRSLKFNVSYASGYIPAITIPLETPKPYNVDTLIKTAPIASSSEQSIIVNPSGNGELFILGLGVIRNRLLGITPFTIKVMGPGNLVVEFLSLNFAHISGQRVSFIEQPLLMQKAPFWDVFAPATEKKLDIEFSEIQKQTISNVLSEMRSMGHGGALIIVPGGWEIPEDVKCDNLVTDKSATGQGLVFENALELASAKEKNEFTDVMSHTTTLKIMEKALANLTSVDGAVIINENLKIIGYGAKLHSEGSLRIVKTSSLEVEGTEEELENISELGGTRHQSMAHFIMAHPEATGFVVSQDGNVTAFKCQEVDGGHRLKVYKKLELTFF
jgi:hypothetical protein